jgi:hypothetical protein
VTSTESGWSGPDDVDGENDSGVLDPEDSLVDRGVDPLDEGWSPAERPWAVDDWGTTEDEEQRGESLGGRLARELPDRRTDDDGPGDGLGDTSDTDGELVDREVGDRRAGRLVEPDDGWDSDVDDELYARDQGYAGGAASAEEAAVHLVPDDRQD